MQTNECSLCKNPLPRNPIIDSIHNFCCMGCHAVFNILLSQNKIEDFANSAVFKQALKSGLISNPLLIEQIRNKKESDNKPSEKIHIEINEMWCPYCAEVIKWSLLREKGVLHCVVDYSTDLASVEILPIHISKERIFEIIHSLGYGANILENSKNKAVSFSLYLQFIIAAFCALNLMMLSYPLYSTYFDANSFENGKVFAWLSFYISIPLIYCFWPIFRRFYQGLMIGMVGMEALVLTGVLTAFGLSMHELLHGGTKVYFDSMSVIITFMLLGKIIETKAKFSAKDSLFKLVRSIPRKGRIRESDKMQKFVPIKDVSIGDELIILTGEKIPIDGVVIEGEGICDESLLTGESLPVEKNINSKVIGGSILQNGWLAVRVTSTLGESTLQKIIEIIELDIGYKSSYVRSADKIMQWFVPTVFCVACFIYIVCIHYGIKDGNQSSNETALLRAIAILLISCPCAIGIAAPLAESQLLNQLASLGAIVRNRGALALLGKETVFAFDKTGTITEGKFRILNGLKNLDEHLLQILKALASQSTHPISKALANEIQTTPLILERVEEFAGKGLKGFYNQNIYYLGSINFLKSLGFNPSEKVMDLKNSSVVSKVIFSDGISFYPIELGDSIKEKAFFLKKELNPARLMLLSGDSKECVESVAKACHFHESKWAQSPLEKREVVENLRAQGEIVCVVGDGINDAPALTAAHVGISVVTATDISIQVSDILLTTDNLSVIPKIRLLTNKGRIIINQNLFWAFFYNVIGMGLAAFGILSPIYATFAMVMSSFIVLFNSKRICY